MKSDQNININKTISFLATQFGQMSQENPVKGDTKPEKENNSQSKNEIANNSVQNVSKVPQEVDEEQKSSHNPQKTPDAIMS